MIYAKISYELILQKKFTESIIICDIVCQWLATGWWFSPGPPPIKLTHDITGILLKVCVKHHQSNKQHYDILNKK